jgi:hypothetical protein
MSSSCLVIMPFSLKDTDRRSYPDNHWQEVYGGLIRPAVEGAGLTCHRDDDDLGSRPIALNIWRKIEEADVILCDVSACNPNVFIELGWALRADRPYVICIDELTQPPFDVGDFNRFQYRHDLRPLALQEQIPRLARMLTDTLQDPNGRCSIVRTLGITPPIVAKRARPRCTVDVYYHESIFTIIEASALAHELQSHGIALRLMEHSGPGVPDALFIGSLVEAEDARWIIGLIPYEIKFLFRPDYPESEGGDSAGYKIGVGYSSRYNESLRTARAEPIPVTRSQLTVLLDSRLTNTNFQHCLWAMTVRF